MFKIIPGNSNLKVSLDKKFVDYNGLECTPPIQGEKVRIEMYGQERWLDLTWVSLIAHYEVYLPDHLVNKIWTIEFTNAHPRAKIGCGKIPILKHPLHVDDEFRVVPGFFRYAISVTGKVLDLRSKEIKKTHEKDDYYPTCELLDVNKTPTKSKGRVRGIVIHRLVALAWIINPDPFGKWMVNHKDGNKRNYHVSNLEWSTPTENNVHAFQSGLRTDNTPCKCRDAYTGEIKEFACLSDFTRLAGIPWNAHKVLFQRKLKHKLFGGRYEIRMNGDNEPWYYETHPIGQKSGRYHVHITYPDGRQETIPDIKTFKKKFGVWNCPNLKAIIDKAKVLYPGMEIEITDHFDTGIVQALCLETGEVFEGESAAHVARRLNGHRTVIQYRLRKGITIPYLGHVFRYKTNEPWPEVIDKNSSSSWCIRATKTDSGEVKDFCSLRSIAKYFEVDRDLIKHRLRTGNDFRGWRFETVTNLPH